MAKRKKARKWPPKGSYPLPNGDFIVEQSMVIDGRRLRVIGQRKAEPDLKKLALAVVHLAKQMAAENQPKSNRLRRRSKQ